METATQSSNYNYVIPDSQFYTTLEQVGYALFLAIGRMDNPERGVTKDGCCYVTSFEDDLTYMLKGIENSIKQGYKMTNEKEIGI